MELEVRTEYLDQYVSCPYTGLKVRMRFLEKSLYERYNLAYPFLFKKVKSK